MNTVDHLGFFCQVATLPNVESRCLKSWNVSKAAAGLTLKFSLIWSVYNLLSLSVFVSFVPPQPSRYCTLPLPPSNQSSLISSIGLCSPKRRKIIFVILVVSVLLSAHVPQLFWARIKDNKVILRYKNFQSAAPAQFWRYNQNNNCSETSIP